MSISRGRVTGYVVVNIAELMGDYDWRLTDKNARKVERVLLTPPASRPPIVGPARGSDAGALSRLPGGIPRAEADLLSRA